jgi:hypothetical protein
MKVECIRAFSATTAEWMPVNPWLTVGRTYIVLAMRADAGREVTLRIVADDRRTAGIFPSSWFESVDDKIPAEWVVKLDDTGTVHLSPKAWLRDGFWEDYFNGDNSAVEEFETIRQAIEAAYSS